MADDPKLAALYALAHAPFVLVCLLAIAIATYVAFRQERTSYLGPWQRAGRQPGDLTPDALRGGERDA